MSIASPLNKKGMPGYWAPTDPSFHHAQRDKLVWIPFDENVNTPRNIWNNVRGGPPNGAPDASAVSIVASSEDGRCHRIYNTESGATYADGLRWLSAYDAVILSQFTIAMTVKWDPATTASQVKHIVEFEGSTPLSVNFNPSIGGGDGRFHHFGGAGTFTSRLNTQRGNKFRASMIPLVLTWNGTTAYFYFDGEFFNSSTNLNTPVLDGNFHIASEPAHKSNIGGSFDIGVLYFSSKFWNAGTCLQFSLDPYGFYKNKYYEQFVPYVGFVHGEPSVGPALSALQDFGPSVWAQQHQQQAVGGEHDFSEAVSGERSAGVAVSGEARLRAPRH